jgi:hypothetical protein
MDQALLWLTKLAAQGWLSAKLDPFGPNAAPVVLVAVAVGEGEEGTVVLVGVGVADESTVVLVAVGVAEEATPVLVAVGVKVDAGVPLVAVAVAVAVPGVDGVAGVPPGR